MDQYRVIGDEQAGGGKKTKHPPKKKKKNRVGTVRKEGSGGYGRGVARGVA